MTTKFMTESEEKVGKDVEKYGWHVMKVFGKDPRPSFAYSIYEAIPPRIDVNQKNTQLAWGAKESLDMNLDEVDQAPMFALNEIIWKSVKGADSEMPLPVHRYWFQKR